MTGPVDLYVELAGPAEERAVLFGGSLGTSGAMWKPQLHAFSAGLRTVVFDHRGHGRSPVPPGPYSIAELGGDVLTLMDQLGLERASYVGLSIGGMVGQWLAANHPDRVDALVLITTSAYLGSPDPWVERAATVRGAGSTEVIADTVIGRWFTPAWARACPGVIAELREMFCSMPVEGYAGCCEALAQLDLRAELSGISAPTLVIGGAQDPSIPPEHQRAIAAAVPGARLEILEDAAHLLSVQQAQTVNGLIAEHLGVAL